jgi:hypothetical protein
LTTEQVLSLAPDAPSAKAGSALATPRKWSNLGRDEDDRLVWGECQGSGAKPYQTRADVGTEPAFKCTCPSRKFPCKHSLGLLLMLATDASAFKTGSRPAWVEEWAASREGRAEKKAARKEKEATAEQTADPAARAKRIAARAEKITAGLEELDLWLGDVIRGGIAGAESRPHSFWDDMAARLVDAQAPGAARLVRELASIPTSGEGWHGRLVAQLGRIYLLRSGWSRYASLPPDTQADLRTHLGWAFTEAELSDSPGVSDTWLVLGQVVDDEDRLRVRRTWLSGASTGRTALLLHFAPGTAPFGEILPVTGESFAAELVFYPASFPQRAFIRARDEAAASKGARPPGENRLDVALSAFSTALARDPWTERVFLTIDGVMPRWSSGAWTLGDQQGTGIPIVRGFSQGWTLIAVSGGRPVWMCGEWNGDEFRPLSVSNGNTLTSLTT